MEQNLYLKTPLVLSSYFVTNSIVHKLLQTCPQVWIPVLPQFWDTVQSLYSNHDRVRLVPYLSSQTEDQIIHNNHLQELDLRSAIQKHTLRSPQHTRKVPVYWDRQLYEYMGMCYSQRYTGFRLPSQIPGCNNLFEKLNPTHEPYVLWHNYTNEHMAGIHIDLNQWRPAAGLPDLKIIPVRLGATTNLLEYMMLIEHAQEIHVVPGSFFFMVDSVLDKTRARLFLHDARECEIIQVNSKWNNWRWNRVDYGVARQ